ncbi:MAG: division/cell wall cluster transcriptional repressor MraZ, partial [Bifidobacterium sp.]
VGTRAELWDSASWQSYLESKEQGYSDIADDVLPEVDF